MKKNATRVLIIEDNASYAKMLEDFLLSQKDSFQVKIAGNLSKGLEQLDSKSVDVVILDLNLPDGEGHVVVDRIYQRAPWVPIIILSGEDPREGFMMEAMEKGVQDYLTKGDFNFQILLRSLRYAILRKKMEEALKDANRALREKLEEFDRLNQIMMDREERILELKKEVKRLKTQLSDNQSAPIT